MLENNPIVQAGGIYLRPSFTEEEKRALIADGARIYLPEERSVNDQKAAGRRLAIPNNIPNALALKARKVEVAIYPYPERFYVNSALDKTLDEQWPLVVVDGQELGQRLGLEGIGEIIPELSEVTEVLFKYQDQNPKRRRLLIREGYYRSIRTNTPTNDIFNKEGKHYITIWVTSKLKSGKPRITEPDKFLDLAWYDFDTLPKNLFLPWKQLLKSNFIQQIKNQLN